MKTLKLSADQQRILNAFPPYPEYLLPDARELCQFWHTDAQCRRLVAKGVLEIKYLGAGDGTAKFRKVKPMADKEFDESVKGPE